MFGANHFGGSAGYLDWRRRCRSGMWQGNTSVTGGKADRPAGACIESRGMDIYLVGGAVRDELLGRPTGERDWLVVGADAETLKRLGYRQVGRDFPVFLHPDTNEEYALARTERKTAPGHRGFAVHAGPRVTLEEDLVRRDLTVNAMAKAADGRLIDPYGGQRDLAARTLRHVGEAFREDPLRVFRVARFAAELLDFSVHAATVELMSDMAATLGELPAERVWAEFRKALAADAPQRFVETLAASNCLGHWFPELEGAQIDARPDSARARFGALGWSLAEASIAALSARLKVPNDHADLARQVARHGRALGGWRTTEPPRLFAAGKSIGALQNLALSGRVCEVVAALAETPLSELQLLFARLAAEVTAKTVQDEGLTGRDLGRRIERERIARLAILRRQALS